MFLSLGAESHAQQEKVMKTIKTGGFVCKKPHTLADVIQFLETTSSPMQHTMSSQFMPVACLARARLF